MGIRRPCEDPPGPIDPEERLLEVELADGTRSPGLSHPTRTITWSEDGLESFPDSDFSPFERVRWRGDPNSYVDVFSEPILRTPPPNVDAARIDGMRFSNVVRIRYTGLQLDPTVEEWDPQAIFADRAEDFTTVFGEPAQVPPWEASLSLRMYDRGECSAAEAWRPIGEAFAEGIEEIFGAGFDVQLGPNDNIDATVSAAPIGNWTVTPEIRQELFGDRDRFQLTQIYEVTIDFDSALIPDVTGFRTVVVVGRFLAEEDQMRFDLLDAFLMGIGGEREELKEELGDVAVVEEEVNELLLRTLAQPISGAPGRLTMCTPGPGGDTGCRNRLDSLLANFALPGTTASDVQPHNVICVPLENDMGECRFVPNVKRVNHRVDGIEIVLSETSPRDELEGRPIDPDPFYPLYRRAGACNEIQRGGEPIACVQDTVFEITPENRGDFICGNHIRELP